MFTAFIRVRRYEPSGDRNRILQNHTLPNMFKKALFTILTLLLLVPVSLQAKRNIETLIVTGQNNHNWQISHKALDLILSNSGMFSVDIALSPASGEDMSSFRPDFNKYDLVILDYNGDAWPQETKDAFLHFVQHGGGLVIYHAADNAFADWDEFNRIIALGGWGGRTKESGPYCYFEAGHLVLNDHLEGPSGNHGRQCAYPVYCQSEKHPIVKGLPDKWMHGRDELYDSMRGPANIKELLYTGRADIMMGGSGREEPLVFTVDYGKSRIFHIMLGHAGDSLEKNPAMQCAGFQTLLLRGCEWAAKGRVTQKVPKDFPTEYQSSYRLDYKQPKKLPDKQPKK